MKSIGRIHDRKFFRRKRDQTAAGRADPQRSIFIKIERAKTVGRQPIHFFVDLGHAFIFFPSHESVFTRRPHHTIARLRKRPHPSALQQFIVERGFKTSVAIARRTTAVAHP